MFNILTHNGRITIRHNGDHRTFQVMTQPDDARFAPGKRVVSLLTDRDNREDFTGFGFVTARGIQLWKRYQDNAHFRAYARLLTEPPTFKARGYEYLEEGACRKCNRALTNPVSIETGIGPVCAAR